VTRQSRRRPAATMTRMHNRYFSRLCEEAGPKLIGPRSYLKVFRPEMVCGCILTVIGSKKPESKIEPLPVT